MATPAQAPAAPLPSSRAPVSAGRPAGAAIAETSYPPFHLPSPPAVVALAGGAIVLLVAAAASGALTVFVVGLIIAYLIDAPITWLSDHHVPRWIGTLLLLALIAAALVVGLQVFFGTIATQGAAFIAALPGIVDSVGHQIAASHLPDGVKEVIAKVGAGIASAFSRLDVVGILVTGLQSALGLVGALFTIAALPFFVFFVAKDRPRLTRAGLRMFPDPWRGDAVRISGIVIGDIGEYVRAQAIIVAVVGILIFGGLSGVSAVVDPRIGGYAIFLAAFAAFAELIPNFGPLIGLIPAALLALTISPAAFVATLVVYLVIAFIEGQLLVPVIQGHQVSLHPAWIMVLIFGGVAMAGVLGAVLAVPLAVTGRDVYRYVFRRAAGLETPPVVDPEGRIISPGRGLAPGESAYGSGTAPAD